MTNFLTRIMLAAGLAVATTTFVGCDSGTTAGDAMDKAADATGDAMDKGKDMAGDAMDLSLIHI